MSLFEWIFNNLYVVAVIAFALFSVLGKLGKSANPNQKRPGNGMPTFGGGEDANRRSGNAAPQQSSTLDDRRYEEQYDQRYDEERYDDQRYDERYDPSQTEPAASSRQASDDTGNYALDNMRSSVDEQMRLMEEQQRAVQKRLNRISSASAPVVSSPNLEDTDNINSGTPRIRPEDIRTGVLWAEVLGPPRSKQPFGTRGKL